MTLARLRGPAPILQPKLVLPPTSGGGGGGGDGGVGAAIVAATFAGSGTTITKGAAPAFLDGDAYDNCLYDEGSFTGSIVASQDVFALTDNYLSGTGQLEIPADGDYRILWSLNTGGIAAGSAPWDALYTGYLYVKRGASTELIDINAIAQGDWLTSVATSCAPHGGVDVPLLAGDIVQLKARYQGSGGMPGTVQTWGNIYIRSAGGGTGTFSGAYYFKAAVLHGGSALWTPGTSAGPDALTMRYDTDSYWDATNKRYNIPADGYYQITLVNTVSFDAGGLGASGEVIEVALSFNTSHPTDGTWTENMIGRNVARSSFVYEDSFLAGAWVKVALSNGSTTLSAIWDRLSFIISRTG